jgi:hypothetical protein
MSIHLDNHPELFTTSPHLGPLNPVGGHPCKNMALLHFLGLSTGARWPMSYPHLLVSSSEQFFFVFIFVDSVVEQWSKYNINRIVYSFKEEKLKR